MTDEAVRKLLLDPRIRRVADAGQELIDALADLDGSKPATARRDADLLRDLNAALDKWDQAANL